MIVLSATFVAAPLEGPLRLILDEAGVAEELLFAPYHQVFQQLLGDGSNLALNAGGINVVLIRLEDFFRDDNQACDVSTKIDLVGKELANAIAAFSANMKGSLIVIVWPPSPSVPRELSASFRSAAETLTRIAAQLQGVHVLDPDVVNQIAGSNGLDALRDQLAHIPFTDEYYAAMSIVIGRRIHALKMPAAKVLVLDCDNTLWRGVVGEDGVEGIEISAPFKALQTFAVAKQAKGILICLVSKNSEADVLRVFEGRSEMVLKLTHIVSHRINWLAKPTNIQSLASELNLGLDSFVFMDDNPIECAQVRAELPQVLTIQVPDESRIETMLENLWAFDKLVTTVEDENRTRMYRENAARRAFESSVPDIEQFMQALALEIDIARPFEDEWSRVEQLMQRTNQFNFTTRRRSAAELQSLLSRGAIVMRVRVKDRFGDYGLVGALVAEKEGDEFRVDSFLLSCRVLGRGVEHAMLRRLGELAAEFHLNEVALPYLKTARNEPARAFADSVAAEFAVSTADGKLYRIPAEKAVITRHRAGHDPAEVMEARLADERKSASIRSDNPNSRSDSKSRCIERLAISLTSGKSVVEELRRRTRRVRGLDGVPAVPETPDEIRMLSIWESLLGICGIGVEDDYFALGGTSLLSVGLFAEIRRAFGAELRLTAILEAPTIRKLSRAVTSSATAAVRQGLICLRPGNVRNVFLVHDGLGETLLYLNLAICMPAGVAVYGIEPKRLPGVPLAHASIEAMAEHYVNLIRQVQPHGPYVIGGMCAGGVIAYAMAVHLVQLRERVHNIVILDAATPQALRRKGRITRARMSSLKSTLVNANDRSSVLAKIPIIVSTLARKATGAAIYEVTRVAKELSTDIRFAILRRAVRRAAGWPNSVSQMTVQEIYNQLESRYVPPPLQDVPVLLVRASSGASDDTPYRDIYEEEDFGWRRVATKLDVIDVDGGHTSMLQARHVSSLSTALQGRLG